MTPDATDRALSPYRAVELSGANTVLCGKMLADLGADVIKVEPPGGDPCRHLEPFFTDPEGREQSLVWRAYNRGKRGITLDLTTEEGRELLTRLAGQADFLIESYPPGTLDGLGLGWKALHALNPRLILVSVTPFGQSGPYLRYKGTDIVPLALGGYMYMCGDKERAPVRVSLPQTFNHASGAGAMGALAALQQRHRTGLGQHVDVSAHHVYLTVSIQPYIFWDLQRTTLSREGSHRDRGYRRPVRVVYPAKDGHVAWLPSVGSVGGKALLAVIERMRKDGFDPGILGRVDWLQDAFATMTAEEIDACMNRLCAYFGSKTKQELFEMALETTFTLAPVYTVVDIFDDAQLRSRGYFEAAPGDDPRLRYPGPALRLSETPLRPGAVAPRLGQHNEDVYAGELGLAGKALADLRRRKAI